MRTAVIAATAALAGSVAASHLGHAVFHQRRAAADSVCTVYTTVYVTGAVVPTTTPSKPVIAQAVSTSCTQKSTPAAQVQVQVQASSPTPPAPAAVSPKPVSPPPAAQVKVQTSSPTPPAPAVVSPKPVPPPPPAPKPEQLMPATGYSSTPYIKTNGNKWAIAYTPYAQNGQCKSQGDIVADIKKIADLGFTTIRSYSIDCGVFEYVVPECEKNGLKVIYGIFLDASKGPFSDGANSQLQAIKDKAPKYNVAMVIVGNECMFKSQCEPSQLAAYIDYVRQELQGAGFPKDLAITTTEPVGTWQTYGAALCDHIDVFAVQIHPYFTASVSAAQAGDFVKEQLDQAAKVCPGAAAKGKFISETGWPKAGDRNGDAIASVADQKIAVGKIVAAVGSVSSVFSFQDDLWKAPGEFDVEQNFGILGAIGS